MAAAPNRTRRAACPRGAFRSEPPASRPVTVPDVLQYRNALMIEPVQCGRALADQIEETASLTPTIWWLGHSGFALKYRRSILYVDPFLSNDRPRLTAPPLSPGQVS